MRVITDCYSIRADARPGAVPTPSAGRECAHTDLTPSELKVYWAYQRLADAGQKEYGMMPALRSALGYRGDAPRRALENLRACGVLPPPPQGTRDDPAMTPAERADYLARLFLLRTAKRAKMRQGAGDELTPDEMNRALGEAS